MYRLFTFLPELLEQILCCFLVTVAKAESRVIIDVVVTAVVPGEEVSEEGGAGQTQQPGKHHQTNFQSTDLIYTYKIKHQRWTDGWTRRGTKVLAWRVREEAG